MRRLGGSVEEQVAALIHDVSHTALSHFVDVVYEKDGEDYHEDIFEQLVLASDIPAILERHNINVQNVIDMTDRSPILEQPLPSLCADRIDYTLRDAYTYFSTHKREVVRFVDSLAQSDEGVLYITTIKQAEWFVELFYEEVIEFFLHPTNIYVNQALKPVLLEAMDAGAILKDDWLLTDKFFLKSCGAMNLPGGVLIES